MQFFVLIPKMRLKCDPINFREDMEGFDPRLFQNLVEIWNSVFNSQVMILRVILFERAFDSVQLKKNCLNWPNKLEDMKYFENNILLCLSDFWSKVAFYSFESTAIGLIWVNTTKRLWLCTNRESENLLT